MSTPGVRGSRVLPRLANLEILSRYRGRGRV